MKDSDWVHPLGVSMSSWVTPSDVTDVIIPEVNTIWGQANVRWNIESIIEEDVVVAADYSAAINYLVNTTRDENGAANPDRLPYLYGLMHPSHRSTDAELGTQLFHIYLFPFVGNTSQGNAMSGFGYHTVIGTWSNKHNGGNTPEKSLLTEDHAKFIRGSLAQTISHELGHVLKLNHNECNNCLMQSNGYSITQAQLDVARAEAQARASR